MKLIFRQLGYLVLFFLPFYCFFFIWSMVSYQPQKILDTEEAAKSIFSTGPKYVVWGRGILRNASNKILLLGSSNFAQGFRPPLLQPLLPGCEIHNLAVNGSNITQLGQIVQLVYEVLPPDSASHNIFVLGIWYGLFVDDKTKWPDGDTSIEVEQLRSPLYKKEQGHIRPFLPVGYLDYLIYVTRPYLFLDSQVQSFFPSTVNGINEWFAARLKRRPDKDKVILDDNYKKSALDFWKDYMGPQSDKFHDEQFLILDKIVDTINQHNDKVIIVDLPLPTWHWHNSSSFRDYQNKKKLFLEKMVASKKVYYKNYQDLDNEFDFYDSAHPKPMTAKKWSERLGKDLRQFCVTLK